MMTMNMVNNSCMLLMIMFGYEITALEESTDFATLTTEKLFRKLKSHELSRKGRTNHDDSFTSKALITSVRVGGHDANLTIDASSALEFALLSLAAASDEIALLARKFRVLHKFHKERRRSPRGYFKCSDTTHFIPDCPKRKKFDSSNKYDYANRNDYNNKGDNKKKGCFRDNNKKKNHFGDNNKKKFKKTMSRACAALSDFNFSCEDSSSS
jgi:hypothetical protein